MKTRFTRFLALCVSAVAAAAVLAAPANAGTLTSASFTTNGTGYAVTGATNARYDWRYTTATSGTTSRVETTVPAGTAGSGERYLAVNGVAGSEAVTPNSVTNAVTSSLDLRVKVSLDNWQKGTVQMLAAKRASGKLSWSLCVNSANQLEFFWSTNGTTSAGFNASIPAPALAGSPVWLRVVAPNGSLPKFYWSIDGSGWTLLSTSGTALAGIYGSDSNVPIELGNFATATAAPIKGKIYYFDLRSTPAPTATSPSTCSESNVVSCFNPNDYVSGTTFTSSATSGETWILPRTGSKNLEEDIAYDLAAAELAGLPSGGVASYRLIDGKAMYVFPNATSIPAGTQTLLALSGFKNTSTPGSYSSNIASVDNQTYPVVIDSVTTGTLTFTDLNGTAIVGTTVDPTFSFTVASHSGTCNGISQTAAVSSTSTGVALGRITSAAGSIAAQDLSVGTNANAGFTVQIRTAGALTSGANTIANAVGTNTTPSSFPASTTAAFGYTVSGLSRFAGAWAGPETTNRSILGASGVGTVTNCIAYQVQVTSSTPAGTYSTTAIYTAVPSF